MDNVGFISNSFHLEQHRGPQIIQVHTVSKRLNHVPQSYLGSGAVFPAVPHNKM